ncbi:MAG: putative phosphohydrolase [uncultured archaeon A07HR60]|nr:MAG: putative phosphohydrolase [uncultured archaeon A07HR60]
MARLERPTAETETQLAVIADPHVGVRSEGGSKLFHLTETHLSNAVADINARNVDTVLSVGDLTKDGEPWNFDAVDGILEELDAPFYAIPGNHDVPKVSDRHETPSADAFANRYTPDGGYPFYHRVGDVDIVGLNTAGTAEYLTDTHQGGIATTARPAAREAVENADDPVVLSHFNLPATFDRLRAHRDDVAPDMAIPPTTRDGPAVRDLLASGDPGVVFTGHLHMPGTVLDGSVREVMVPTTCSYPQAYCTATIGPGGTTVRFHQVAATTGLRHAYATRSRSSTTSSELTAMAAERLARFPLVEEM